MPLAAFGLGGVAVAAQVGADDGEALGEPRRDPVPHRVRLRIAVQQQERRPAAADPQLDLGTRAGDAPRLETGKEGSVGCRHVQWFFRAARIVAVHDHTPAR